ncbi:hypothetical protein TNCV_4281331 [Trichonephila clavipes]|nr:hypothetical protein TNCV_4281331 [Trichonephila clavipes]
MALIDMKTSRMPCTCSNVEAEMACGTASVYRRIRLNPFHSSVTAITQTCHIFLFRPSLPQPVHRGHIKVDTS